ncbi:MAG TPA: DUF2213 domain-containing protein [Caulobacteraceae bacterium]|jgi:hypothetical protein|nr:DUF2213 domain-containing protein [Caulobacteraceae bacterium]
MSDATLTLAIDSTNRFVDVDGRMHVRVCNLSKANVCGYLGREIPGWQELGLEAERVYKLYRDPVELAKAAPTVNNIQLLDVHIGVSADDPKKERVAGSTGTDAAFVAPYLQNSLVIWDAGAIAGVETNQKRELSCSYRYRPDMTPGSTSQSETFDGVMRDIAFNHVALVEQGRAGHDVLVADAKLETSPMSKAAQALQDALKGKLASDAQIDFPALAKLAADAEKEDREAKDKKAKDDEREEERKEAEQTEAKDKAARDKAAKDKKAKDDEAEQIANEDRKAKDKKAKDEEEAKERDKEEAEDRAKDAASKAVTAALAARDALDAAKVEVRPYVGEVTTACDSAEAVYKFAFDAMGVDVKGVHASAFGAILRAHPKPGGRPAPRLAADGANDDFNTRFPGAQRFGRA